MVLFNKKSIFSYKIVQTVLFTGLIGASSSLYAAPVKVGGIFPMSGNFATFGIQCYKGLELAVEEANANGGVKGEKIQLIKADAADTTQAVSETRRLISMEGVKAIFGTYASGLSYAATPVAELAGVPFFELTGTADNITERGFKYLFRASAPASYFGISSMDALKEIVLPHHKLDPKNIKAVVIHEDSLYGSSVAKKQVEIAEAEGIEIVKKIPYSAKTVDLSSAVLLMKQANPDVVLHTGYQNDTILLSRQMEEAGYKPKILIGGGGGYSLSETRKAVGEKLDGIISTDFALVNINPEGAKGLTEFIENYKKKFNEDPTTYSLISYAGAKAFIQGLNNAKSLDRDDIRDAVLALDEPVGSQATGYGVKYSENGQNTRANMVVTQWQDGKLVAIYPENIAVAKPILD